MSEKARRFARNVGFSVFGQALAAAASFFCLPYLVGRLGNADYGLYILMHTTANYVLLLTFGAGPTAVKFISEFWGARSARGLSDTLRCSLAVHLAGVLSGAVLVYSAAEVLASGLFQVPAELLGAAVLALRAAALGAVLAAAAAFASSVLQGLQRFDLNNAVVSVQNGLMPVGAVAAVYLGWGLNGALWWYPILNAAAAVLGLAACWMLLRPAAFWEPGPELEPKTFLSYSASMWLALVAWVVTFQCDKIFLARGTSLADLTLYSVPASLVQRVQVMGPLVSNVLLPMMSELRGDEAQETLVRMYLKSSRFLLWAVSPALVLLFVLMPQFLGLWLGGDFAGRGAWPARLLVLATFCFLLNAIPNAVACGRGKPWAMTIMVWAQAALSVLGWWVLVPRWGILGVALGSLLAQAAPTAAYLLWVHSGLLGLKPGQYLRQSLLAPMASSALLLLLLYPVHAFVDGWIKLIGCVAGGLLLYYAAAYLQLDQDDKRLLGQLLRAEPAAAARVS